jgi:hypothetical protein
MDTSQKRHEGSRKPTPFRGGYITEDCCGECGFCEASGRIVTCEVCVLYPEYCANLITGHRKAVFWQLPDCTPAMAVALCEKMLAKIRTYDPRKTKKVKK